MNAKRLTLIRRALTQIERAKIILGFGGDAILHDHYRRAEEWLKRAKRTTLGGNSELAELSMRNACAHLGFALERVASI